MGFRRTFPRLEPLKSWLGEYIRAWVDSASEILPLFPFEKPEIDIGAVVINESLAKTEILTSVSSSVDVESSRAITSGVISLLSIFWSSAIYSMIFVL